MSRLHTRLKELDDKGEEYWLDFITMRGGFVYRNATVLSHDETSIIIKEENHPETYISIPDIASTRIRT